ncbi:MAG: hypothetical protein CK426_08080 [Legionella sp.]|nr:MAG: hypothetical protein CK423_00985 [Legionella sp.]PJD97389.1 MAG: hypothetical protein CK426_08080 [Legionella sp.]
MNKAFYEWFSPKMQFYVFIMVLFIFYCLIPLGNYFLNDGDIYFLKLSLLSCVSMLFLFIGFKLANLIKLNKKAIRSIKITHFIACIFIVFLFFVFLIVVTAKSIPLIDAFRSYNVDQLVESRGNFLKARQGYERILLYANGILTTSFLPYIIILTFVNNLRYKWLFLLIPYFYSFIFLEKAFFLKFILPFLSYCSVFYFKKNYRIYFWVGIISIPFMIYTNTVLSGFGSDNKITVVPKDFVSTFFFLGSTSFLKFMLPFLLCCSVFYFKKNCRIYFWVGILSIPLIIYANTMFSGFAKDRKITVVTQHSASISDNSGLSLANETVLSGLRALFINPNCQQLFYSARFSKCANDGRLTFIIWRLFAVPIFTATDSIKLFETKYQNQYFWGRTSFVLSTLFNQKRLKFEHEVFKSQWGDDSTRTASANSVYIVEQYVNFGWFGVIMSSIFIGYIFGALKDSQDVALSSLMIIFSYSILLGGFLSTLFSGGYLLLFICLYFIKFNVFQENDLYNNSVRAKALQRGI